MFKKLITGLAVSVCLMIFVGAGIAQQFEDTRAKQYVGNVNSLNYHCINCEQAKNISPQEKVVYNSAEEAVRAGCRPCPVCNPPVKN